MSARNSVDSIGLKMENNTVGKQKGKEEKNGWMERATEEGKREVDMKD